MTKSLQVSCVQMHWARSLKANLERTLHYIKAAADCGSRVVLFPEASLTSYYFPFVVTLSQRYAQTLSVEVILKELLACLPICFMERVFLLAS